MIQAINTTEKQKEYLIKAFGTITLFEYERGEIKFENEYRCKETIKAISPKEAIDQFIYKNLGYSFDIDNIEPDEALGFSFDILINSDNYQASVDQVEQWKKGEIKLFNDYVNLYIFDLTPITVI